MGFFRFLGGILSAVLLIGIGLVVAAVVFSATLGIIIALVVAGLVFALLGFRGKRGGRVVHWEVRRYPPPGSRSTEDEPPGQAGETHRIRHGAYRDAIEVEAEEEEEDTSGRGGRG